ncbi:MAG: DUF1501 domain-containing protein [Verrucomicrobiota bacterium]
MNPMNRRDFLLRSGQAALGAATLLGANGLPLLADEKKIIYPKGKADHCIFIWLGGGAAQIDTWDPKRKGDGKKIAGSYYDSIDTAIPGVKVCEHLGNCAKILDRFVLFRSVHHDVIDEHAAATNRLHTGRRPAGTVQYPSIGSIVARRRKPAVEGVPAYVVIGYPNVTRGPGFLGASAGYVYLTDTEAGPAGLSRAADVSPARQVEREALLNKMRQGYLQKHPSEKLLGDYDTAIGESFKLSRGDFMSAFQLEKEPGSLRQSYGNEFGQRCLLARRLVQTGVRFVEVSFNLNFLNGAGWDTHNQAQLQQHVLIKELDVALSSLVLDLEKNKMLDRTLVVVATEFGRPAQFDGGGGRGHYGKAFSMVMAGGGLKTGQVVGETDELAMNIVKQPVSVPDFHANIHCALGINPSAHLYDEDRPVPITDMGEPARQIFA